MPAKLESATPRAKKKLGDLIASCRGKNMSQRQLALAVGLPPSNMKYIEDGINCPTPDVYTRLISVLNPSQTKLAKLDRAYMDARNMPPPDVCDKVKKDQRLMDIIRSIDSPLTESQSRQIVALLGTFSAETANGDQSNG